MLNINSGILFTECESDAVKIAADALKRDIKNTCLETDKKGMNISLKQSNDIASECFIIKVKTIDEGDENGRCLVISASDDLGLIYGIYFVSKEFLGVNEFWFWNEQIFVKKEGYEVPDDFYYESKPYKVRFRGWFVNDEVLIDDWKPNGDNDLPWEMTFEALLRCGGNMTIPGTDENAHIYCEMASKMGLWITHHHAEPLGAQMFARAYPDFDASYDKYPDLFEKLWREGIEKQKNYKVIWNLGFRGQGDRPFWADDPAYDTDEKRGALISKLIRKQYDLVRSYDGNAIFCSNLYGETMELYKKGLIDLPEDVIYVWADNGFGKMVSRRQGNHNPRVYSLPEDGTKGKHGIYYHASFYDLQAAAQMTMLPNSPEFVVKELLNIYDKKADDFWVINCSNVKPHAYYLGLIAEMWKEQECFDGFGGKCVDDKDTDKYVDSIKGKASPSIVDDYVNDYCLSYCSRYYGKEYSDKISELYKMWPLYCPLYGPNEDDHAGEQFTNHGARVLTTAFITGFDAKRPACAEAAREWLWFSNKETLREQIAEYKAVIEPAAAGYKEYLDKCMAVYDDIRTGNSDAAQLLYNTLIWQVEYHMYSFLGALHTCRALEACLITNDAINYLKAFYEAGLGAKAFKTGYEKMRDAEKGIFKGFYENDCEADIRQSYYVLMGLMSFVRFHGDGPHFYKWQRMFQQGAGGNKVHLILRIRKHLTDEELFDLIKISFLCHE